MLGKKPHEKEALDNLKRWEKKPLLQDIYRDFYRLIARNLAPDVEGNIVELGSGIGKIKEIVPDCICTDIFPFPWLDGSENAYALSFADGAVSNIIQFDVFQHFRYPGSALDECRRVLCPGGRLLIFEPYISWFGRFVYGVLHHEPVGIHDPIPWHAPPDFDLETDPYYTGLGNAMRIFETAEFAEKIKDWELVELFRLSGVSYILSGGYSKPQFYPHALLPAMMRIDALCSMVPALMATRMLVVLQKPK